MKKKSNTDFKGRYNKAKASAVGSVISCPSCGVQFTKTNYQQVFCKTKGGTKCKDYYWNNVTPTKRNNTTRISPASYAYMNSDQKIADREDREENELNEDGSWGAHQAFVERCEWCGYLNCRCES